MIKNFMAVAALVGGLAACAEMPSSVTADADAAARLSRKASSGGVYVLPPGANWNNNEGDFRITALNTDQVALGFRITGLGNATGQVQVDGNIDALVIVSCTKQNGRGRTDFERTQSIKGSGKFDINKNGEIRNAVPIYRGNGNGAALEFCKSQNFSFGEILEIKRWNSGYVEVPSTQNPGVLPRWNYPDNITN